jgi:hypothetical protein
MIAIAAGVFLWCFVIVSYVVGTDLGSTTTLLLLALGAILVASYSIQSMKISASGFEITTREHQSAPVQLNISIPTFDYINLACLLAVLSFVLLGVLFTLMPHDDPPSSATTRVGTLLIWSAIFSVVAFLTYCFRPSNRKPVGGDRKPEA